jgi:exopolysaccharide biosynthesis polyprenyl glycosylphosphotransferase
MTSTADARALLPGGAVGPRAELAVLPARRRGGSLVRFIVPAFDVAALGGAVAVGLTRWHGGVEVWVYAVTALVVLASTGTQRSRINPRLGDDLVGLLGRVAVALLPLALLPQPGTVLRVAALAAFLVPCARCVSYATVRRARRLGRLRENTLLVGAGEVGVEVATMIQSHPEFGLIPVGFLDSYDDDGLPLPILGDANALHRVLQSHRIRRVIVAFGFAPDPQLVRLLREVSMERVDVHVVPRFFELGVNARTAFNDDLWGIPLVRLRRAALTHSAQRVKRAFDVALTSLILLLIAPLLALIAVAVRLSSPGPALFSQKRLGQHGRVIEVLKFRTMQVNDDGDTRWGVGARDERVTRLGRVLRISSLDELPQLFNVLRGEMSLVGPRPERPVFAERFAVEVPRYDDRHRVPVGITGWAQVHGLRGDTPIRERARFDNSYIENWSPFQDLRILVRTALSVLTHRGY